MENLKYENLALAVEALNTVLVEQALLRARTRTEIAGMRANGLHGAAERTMKVLKEIEGKFSAFLAARDEISLLASEVNNHRSEAKKEHDLIVKKEHDLIAEILKGLEA